MSKDKNFEHKAENPIIDDFSDNAYRVRRNLILFAIISLFYKLSGAVIDEKKINILGTNFEIPNNHPQHFIDWFLCAILVYHFVHFLWFVFEHWTYHIKIRTTGNFKDFFNGMAFGEQEIPNKRKSSFYKIFLKSGAEALSYPRHIKELKSGAVKIMEKIAEDQKLEMQNFIKDETLENKILGDIATRNNQVISEIRYMLETGRSGSIGHQITQNHNQIRQFFTEQKGCKELVERLENFDKHWEFYQKSQIWRWIIIEYGIPLFVGIFAILCFCDWFLSDLLFLINHFFN